MVILTSTDGKSLWGIGEDAHEAMVDAKAHTFHDSHPFTVGADKGVMQVVITLPAQYDDTLMA